MIRTLLLAERHARYVITVVALLSVIALGLYKTGLVSMTPVYNDQAWYSFSKYVGFVISTEHSSEAACRATEKSPGIACHSGKALVADPDKVLFN